MKKVLIGLVIIVVLIGGGIYYLIGNLDNIVKSAIETAGTEALGTEVKVGSVELDLLAGTASIFDFSIANPEGFSNQRLMSFAELSISLDLNNISGDAIGIRSIVAREPYMLYEMQGDTSNLDAMSANLGSDTGNTSSSDSSSSSNAGPNLTIDSILIESIQGTLESDLLQAPLMLNLGDITLQDLSGSPEEIASQVAKPIITQLSTTAANAVLTAMAGMNLEDIEAAAEERLDEEVEVLKDKARAELDEALGEDVRKGLENLLR